MIDVSAKSGQTVGRKIINADRLRLVRDAHFFEMFTNRNTEEIRTHVQTPRYICAHGSLW